jgi:hypothetical protein
MHELNDILSRGLTQPKEAIFYAISQSLTRAFPGKFVLETESCSFAVERFAYDGLCSMEPEEGVHENSSVDYIPRHDLVYERAEHGFFRIEWEDQTLFLLLTGIYGQYQRTKRWYLIADTEELAREFYLRVERWTTEVRGEVLVFQDGHWSKSQDLFTSIQSTTLDSLVLPGRMREEIADNFRQFFDSASIYDQYGIPWKRGVLMLGPPGNGKTHMIKGLVNSLGKPCLYVRSFKSEYATEHGNISHVFDRARASSPCMLVLEDLDSLVDGRNRSFFLNEMDGFDSNRGILTVATTNRASRPRNPRSTKSVRSQVHLRPPRATRAATLPRCTKCRIGAGPADVGKRSRTCRWPNGRLFVRVPQGARAVLHDGLDPGRRKASDG